MTIHIENSTIHSGGDNEAKKELALAIKANAEAAKALAERMATESYGIYIEGDSPVTHNYYAQPDAAEDADDDYEADEE